MPLASYTSLMAQVNTEDVPVAGYAGLGYSGLTNQSYSHSLNV